MGSEAEKVIPLIGILLKALSHCTANPRERNPREIPGVFSPHQYPSDHSHCTHFGNSRDGISRGYGRSFHTGKQPPGYVTSEVARPEDRNELWTEEVRSHKSRALLHVVY